jgi:hypothetical protein
MDNYEKAYQSLLPWLAGIDGALDLDFLGRRFRVSSLGVEQLSGAPSHVNAKSVIIWYVARETLIEEMSPIPKYGGGDEPSYEFRPLSDFSFGIFSGHGTAWQDARNSRIGSLGLEDFRRHAERIGAKTLRPERYGESRLLHAFPELAVMLTFSEADDEFPADINVKFGSNATRILPFETLAVLQGLILDEFAGRSVRSL